MSQGLQWMCDPYKHSELVKRAERAEADLALADKDIARLHRRAERAEANNAKTNEAFERELTAHLRERALADELAERFRVIRQAKHRKSPGSILRIADAALAKWEEARRES